ncbi:MAG: hypothetical protein IJ570_03765 [Prevotella sp.]|nr:hypothetical protein [Prevotella sp.]
MFFCLMALGSMLAFTACGDDDDDILDDIINGGEEVVIGKAEFTESANQLVLKYTTGVSGLSVSTVWTCTFNGETLVKSTMASTYPSDALAKVGYDEAVLAYGSGNVNKSGKTITVDNTKDFEDMTKDLIRMTMQSMKEQYSR